MHEQARDHSENLQLQKPENDLQKLLNHYKIV